jgi:hypothetical protein
VLNLGRAQRTRNHGRKMYLHSLVHQKSLFTGTEMVHEHKKTYFKQFWSLGFCICSTNPSWKQAEHCTHREKNSSSGPKKVRHLSNGLKWLFRKEWIDFQLFSSLIRTLFPSGCFLCVFVSYLCCVYLRIFCHIICRHFFLSQLFFLFLL